MRRNPHLSERSPEQYVLESKSGSRIEGVRGTVFLDDGRRAGEGLGGKYGEDGRKARSAQTTALDDGPELDHTIPSRRGWIDMYVRMRRRGGWGGGMLSSPWW
jgi:hypothetical protein